MKIEVLSGLGALLMILPCFSMGLSYLDNDSWPPLSDLRWIMIVLGVLLLIVARALYRREASSNRDAAHAEEVRKEQAFREWRGY
ncbi:hypothetical protein ACGF5M_03140 [Gemmatimonadota bacterium]